MFYSIRNFLIKKKTVKDFTVKKLLVPIFEKGKLVYNKPTLEEIRANNKTQMATLWDEVVRLESPHQYYVDLSQNLWDLKQELIKKYKKKQC